jgi:hypothetical protein
MLNLIKCLGVSLDLAPRPLGGGYMSYLQQHQLEQIFSVISQENPAYTSADLRKTASQILQQLYPTYTFTLSRTSEVVPSQVTESVKVQANAAEGTLTINNTGYTLRTLQGAASAADPTRRKWKVIMCRDPAVYKGFTICELLMKTDMPKGAI